ncbi:MAG TPA: hypothetical protein VIH89_10865 [Candidatus Sulfotelmatobacter sp.]
MNSVHFLYAALCATVVIHVSYIGILFTRYKRLREQMKDQKRS